MAPGSENNTILPASAALRFPPRPPSRLRSAWVWALSAARPLPVRVTLVFVAVPSLVFSLAT